MNEVLPPCIYENICDECSGYDVCDKYYAGLICSVCHNEVGDTYMISKSLCYCEACLKRMYGFKE